MNILYVCLGNRFRSLLAEAVTRKERTDKEVRSRGTEATGPIHDEVREILEENDLKEHASMDPTQLSQDDIDWADKIVFMSRSNLNYVEENLEPDGTTFQVWDIPDADPEDPLRVIFEDIEKKVNELED